MRGKLIVGAVTAATAGMMAAGLWAGAPALAEYKADDAPTVYGLTTDGDLVTFSAANPGETYWIGEIEGLEGDTSLVGIDFRVQNGLLYGVGDAGGVYTFDLPDEQPQATLSRPVPVAKVSQLTVALEGENFGVDFNPAANRLRIVSDTGQNLRHNIDDPSGAPVAGETVADDPLTTPPSEETTTGVSAAAYTNNDLDPSTGTTLFDINTTTDQVLVQSPANRGKLVATGSLLVDAGAVAGMDIYSELAEGRTVNNTGYASLEAGGSRQFYQVSVLTGAATLVGAFPENNQVTEIAVELDN